MTSSSSGRRGGLEPGRCEHGAIEPDGLLSGERPRDERSRPAVGRRLAVEQSGDVTALQPC
jgi:hypothetical protein